MEYRCRQLIFSLTDDGDVLVRTNDNKEVNANDLVKNLIKFLYSLREFRKYIPITDVFLKEQSAPFVKFGNTLYPVALPMPAISPITDRDAINYFVYLFIEPEITLADIPYVYEQFLKKNKGGIDFSFFAEGLASFRVNYSVGVEGIHLAIRWNDKEMPQVEDLLPPPAFMQVFEGMLREDPVEAEVLAKAYADAGLPQMAKILERNSSLKTYSLASSGLFVDCGPTGSGKTTFMMGVIASLARKVRGRFLTYENPVEYPLTPRATVGKIERFETTAFEDNPTAILNHILRNAPTGVLIGETRSEEEIRNVIDVASRGHFTITTIHASNAVEALQNLMSLGEDSNKKLATSLRCIVSHRLIKLSLISPDGKKKIELAPVYECLFIPFHKRNDIRKGDIKSLITAIFNDKNLPYISFDAHYERVVKPFYENKGYEITNDAEILASLKKAGFATQEDMPIEVELSPNEVEQIVGG
jgi:Tfp pilus assembly pilus retraction ATPase PilT